VVTARLDGRDLGYDTLRIGEVQLQADWAETGGRAVLHAAGLASGDLLVDAIDSELTGTPDAHALGLTATAPDLQLSLGARGGLAEGSWRGELQRLALTEPVLGSWLLRAPAKLELGTERLHSSQLCLDQQQADTRLCLAGGWAQATGLAAEGELRGLDLAPFAAQLPGEVEFSGQLAGDFQVSGPLDNPRAQLHLRPSDGRLSLATDDEPLELAYRDARLTASFADDSGSAELSLRLGDGGHADGRLTLGKGPDRALAGQVSAQFPDLELVEGFVPDLTEVRGRLQLDMTLAGTVAAPRAAGQLQVLEASANLPAAGLELRDIALAVRGDGQGPLQLSGGVRSGDGRLQVRGEVDPAASGGPAVDLRITGEAFQVARLPEAVVEIAPQLRLAGQGPYHLDGTLRIPKARIELEELPSGSVSVSDDEVVVGEEAPPGRGGPSNLTAAVRVELGEAVTFKGFGLSTGLTGALDAAVDDQGSRLHGKIELRDAAYQAYGQDLKVEQGRLLFAGPPDNPELDMRAVRESRDGRVKAYLDVRGPAAKPRLRVFSEPTLPEAEALAYLLTGRGLDQAGQQEGVNIAAAALSLGLAQGEPLLQDLGNRLGLDELRYEGGTDPSAGGALVLGKYLNPNLYLGYSQGLFNPEGAVLLRLKLSERLDVESRAGTEQAIDLLYRYEHD
jgi:translocation and assembly module TamB